jgi:hypothetical protein
MLSGNCPLTPAGNRRRPSETLLGQWIKFALIDILPESIIKVLKTSVSHCMNGAEDGVLWEEDQKKNSLLVMKVLVMTS